MSLPFPRIRLTVIGTGTDYRAIDPVALGQLVAQRNIVDARCALDGAYWRSAGWAVRILGRP
jgi:UDPglucose 6-dehydrogenase